MVHKVIPDHANDIGSTGEGRAIQADGQHLVGGGRATIQGTYLTAGNIVQNQGHRLGRCHTKLDIGLGIKRIREGLVEHIGIGQFEGYLDDGRIVEGAKAQAVAIRTYALFYSKRSRKPYDLTDHEFAQVYEGYARETRLSRQAALATRGQVLTQNRRLIESVYSSSSGGHTANNEDVWNTEPRTYLRGVPDPYDDSMSPYKNWTVILDRKDLLIDLSNRYGFELNGILVGTRSSDGRLRTVILRGENGVRRVIPASSLRAFVNKNMGEHLIKSTFFDLAVDKEDYIFEGRGYGHGVGLSQWGTVAQARDGRDYQTILNFYYTNVDLTNMDGSPTEDLGVALDETDVTLADAKVPMPNVDEDDTTQKKEKGPGWGTRLKRFFASLKPKKIQKPPSTTVARTEQTKPRAREPVKSSDPEQSTGRRRLGW